MATVPSPSPPPRAASDSGNSSPNNQVEPATNNGVCHVDVDKKPKFTDGLDHLDSPQCIERFRKYNDDYTHRLLSKYFSTNGFYGGNIFDVQITIDGEVIKSSSLSCLKTYTDPVVGFEEQCSNGSTPPADSQANLPNGKHVVKKN